MGTYTIYDGTVINMPDGLSKVEADNIATQAFPYKAALAGTYYDREAEYNTKSGVKDLGLRWGAALARGNINEISAEMDQRAGAGNWGLSDFDAPYVTAQGLRNLGLEPEDERKVLLDGSDFTRFDLVDIGPEAIIGGVATIAELFPFPGTGAPAAIATAGALRGLTRAGQKLLTGPRSRAVTPRPPTALVPYQAQAATVASMPTAAGGFSRLTARAFSPTLLARSMRAGVGTTAASLGLEAHQSLRGTQRQSPGQIFLQAGIEGLMVGVGSLALGLPLALIGPLAGRAAQAGQKYGTGISLSRLQQRQQAMVAAEANVRNNLTGKINPETGAVFTAAEIDDIMIHVSLKELFGQEGSFGAKQMAVLEGMGVKQKGDAYVKDSIRLMETYKKAVLDLSDQNLTIPEYVRLLKQRLTQAEQTQMKDTFSVLKKFFEDPKFGSSGTAGAKSIDDIINLVGVNLSAQYRHGQGFFKTQYDGLSTLIPELQKELIDSFSPSGTATTNNLAHMVNNIADELGVGADQALNILSKLAPENRAIISKITSSLDLSTQGILGAGRKPVTLAKGIKVTANRGKPRIIPPTEAEVAAWWKGGRVGPEPKGTTISGKVLDETDSPVVNARDLYELDQGLRKVLAESMDNNNIRQGALISKQLQNQLDDTLPGNFSKEWSDVRSKYKDWIRPFNRTFEHMQKTTAQSARGFVEDIVKKRRKGVTFASLMDDLEKVMGKHVTGRAGIVKDKNGNYIAPAMSADQLIGDVGIQYMRHIKQEFNLTPDDFTNYASQGPDGLRLMRQQAGKALRALRSIEKVATDKKFKSALNKMFGNAGFTKYKSLLEQIRDGKPGAARAFNAQLSFKASQQFVDDVGKLWRQMDKKSGGGFVAENLVTQAERARVLFDIDPKSKEMYHTAMFSELYEKFLSADGLGMVEANTLLRDLGEAVYRANRDYPDSLKTILGPDFYKPMVDLATLIKGAHNIDPTAGAISAAGLPIAGIRGALNLSFSGVVKPSALMFAMARFAPGGVAWNAIRATRGYPVGGAARLPNVTPAAQAGVKTAQKFMKGALSNAQSKVNMIHSGRDGLWAASVASYMSEINATAPMENETQVLPVDQEEQEQALEQEQKQQTNNAVQQVGTNLMATLSALNSAQNPPPPSQVNVRTALAQGRSIAQGGTP